MRTKRQETNMLTVIWTKVERKGMHWVLTLSRDTITHFTRRTTFFSHSEDEEKVYDNADFERQGGGQSGQP